jgi:hypothetical protein
MTKSLFLLVSLFLFCSQSFAETAEQEYQTLCSYDSKWCNKVKNSDGTFVRPKKEIVQLLKELAPTIEKHSKAMGVDVRAVAGAIMAENSLNVSISDDVQNLLVKIGVANKGEILGKKFTYGLGQLNFSAAREAENYAAKLEKRAPLGDVELSDALLIPEKAIYYVAAVIRKVQDDYKEQGIDISGKPEILTTLYNLGKSSTKASEAKAYGKTPRPNYFGFFVKKYERELSFLKPVVTPVEVASKTEPVKTAVKTEKKTLKIVLPSIAPVETKKLLLAFTKSMPLYSSPPVCESSRDYGATNIQKKYGSMKTFAVTSIADKEKTFEVVAPTIDCEANTWELIKLSSGEAGWIRKEELEKNTAKILIAEPKCNSRPDVNCIAKLKDELKDILYPNEKNKDQMFLKPSTKSKKASFSNPDWECRADDVHANNGNFNNGGYSLGMTMTGNYYGPTAKKIAAPVNTNDELKNTLTKIDEKTKQLEEYYKAPIDSPHNPYSNISLGTLKIMVKRCAEKQSYNLESCQTDLKGIEKFLGDFETKPKLTKQDYDYLNYNLMMVSYGQKYLSKADYLTAISNNSFNNGYFSYGGMGIGSFGMPTFPAQYLFREGDEKSWSIADVEEGLKECQAAMNELDTKINIDPLLNPTEKLQMSAGAKQVHQNMMNGAFSAFSKLKAFPKEEQEKAWSVTHADFIQSAKFCLSLRDTFNLTKIDTNYSPAIKSYNCYFQNLEVLENGTSIMLKEMVNEMMYTPQGLATLNMYSQMAFNQNAAMSLIPPAPAPNVNTKPIEEVIERKPSYCPNKTAEDIENLIQNYPCVNKVYVPDRWLLNRLNSLGEKVIYRPFSEDDRYAVDVEKKQCN